MLGQKRRGEPGGNQEHHWTEKEEQVLATIWRRNSSYQVEGIKLQLLLNREVAEVGRENQATQAGRATFGAAIFGFVSLKHFLLVFIIVVTYLNIQKQPKIQYSR